MKCPVQTGTQFVVRVAPGVWALGPEGLGSNPTLSLSYSLASFPPPMPGVRVSAPLQDSHEDQRSQSV